MYFGVWQVIVGPQRDSRVYDIIEKVAAAKGAPLIAVSRSVVKFKTGILFTCTGHPYQFCDMLIQHPPGPEFEALQKVLAVHDFSRVHLHILAPFSLQQLFQSTA